MKLCILDSEPKELRCIDEQISAYLRAQRISAEMTAFSSVNTLLSAFRNVKFDMAFVNTDLKQPDINGIILAKILNTLDKGCKIVFLSAELHDATEIFGGNPFYFVYKPELALRLPAIFEKAALRKAWENDTQVILTSKGKREVLSAADIVYAEHSRRQNTIYCVHGACVCREKLAELAEKLDSAQFARCHNSFLVNLAHVRELSRTALTLSDGTRIPVSRTYYDSVRAALARFLPNAPGTAERKLP